MSQPHQPSAGPPAPWAALIPDDQWEVFMAGRRAAERADVPFLLGGAMALAAFTGRWRNTKDIDFVVLPGRQDALIAELLAAGFEDLHAREPYDRSWIFRGVRDGVILDVIWTLPNHRVDVDDAWFAHARPVCLHGEEFRVVPLEELIRMKLYVMQRERCDWVDVLNALAGSIRQINWPHLLSRMGPELPLLQSILVLFAWLAPGRAAAIPVEVRTRFALPDVATDDPASTEERRVKLFDCRPWYAAFQPEDQPLER